MDVVFVLDSSGSIGGEHFETTKSFVINTIDVLDIERDQINVGFVQFSSTVTGEGVFKLNQFDSRQAAIDAVTRMRYVHFKFIHARANKDTDRQTDRQMTTVKKSCISGFLLFSFIHGTTNTAHAIQYAIDDIFTARESDGDRRDVEDLVILITDGGSDDKESTYNVARLAKQRGIHIVSIGNCSMVKTIRFPKKNLCDMVLLEVKVEIFSRGRRQKHT